jgi:hypothetical protein
VKKHCSHELFGKLALPGVILGLFTVAAFIPELNSGSTVNNNRDNTFYTFANQTIQPVFKAGVECINLAEPVGSSISKIPSFSVNTIPAYASSGFQTNNQYPWKYIYFSDHTPYQPFREICLFLDLPPPAVC